MGKEEPRAGCCSKGYSIAPISTGSSIPRDGLRYFAIGMVGVPYADTGSRVSSAQ